MASLTKSSRSPFWIARIRVWVDSPGLPRGGFYRQTMRSTKLKTSVSRKAALRVADEMERVAREAAKSPPSEAVFGDMLVGLLRAANVPVPKTATTWRKALADFLRSTDAGARSQEQYRQQGELFAAFLGVRAGHDLRSITGDDFMGFYRHLQAEGRSANTARNAAKTVRRILERSRLMGFIERNPAMLHTLRGGASFERQPFTRQDVTEIFAHIEAYESPEWRIACLFGLYYGMRIGDAVSRSFDEIEEQDGVRVLRFIPTKKARTGKSVVLPMVGSLADLRGDGKITPELATLRSPSKAFGKLLDRAGFERKRAEASGKGRAVGVKSFHSFRHTVNSLLVDAGVDSRVRQLICGHADARVAAGYTHASVETMATALSAVTKLR